ncbi:hypothetical protein [Chondrinema litorale]|uniref:hypothetical protein n=1 Tax=Chondrinema litorale TaxID=2994555 RepID=UPI0025430BB9|nr:hypothetical protein [Chondrinema litorale]UZR93549.1 hypothetical protein OQ292_16990 [Chondrinema litorale]
MPKNIALATFWFCFLLLPLWVKSQSIPADEENVPYLVTFGKQAESSYGDNDNQQVFFVNIPAEYQKPFFIRVFDPDTGGSIDEQIGEFDTQSNFSIYGGSGTFTNRDMYRAPQQSGTLLSSRTFANNPANDGQWFSFGPFNPLQGEMVNEMEGYIFKITCTGLQGNDGNLYRYFVSTDPNVNRSVEGANAFTYQYTFRLPETPGETVHIYPYVTKDVVSIKQYNYDFDSDGLIHIVSMSKNGEAMAESGNGEWQNSTHMITKEEQNTSLDIRFIKSKNSTNTNNNLVFYITNQYGVQLPFYTIPIGGIPRYKYKISVKRINRN